MPFPEVSALGVQVSKAPDPRQFVGRALSRGAQSRSSFRQPTRQACLTCPLQDSSDHPGRIVEAPGVRHPFDLVGSEARDTRAASAAGRYGDCQTSGTNANPGCVLVRYSSSAACVTSRMSYPTGMTNLAGIANWSSNSTGSSRALALTRILE